ncbi:MAG: nuclear transport factor 2 family protein [Steroidobacteraceae bacterium]
MLSLWIAVTLTTTTAAGGCRHPPEARDLEGLDCLLDDGFTSGARGTVRSKSEMLAQLPHRATGALEIRELDVRVVGHMGYICGLDAHHPQAILVYESGANPD